jgi:hypothetical protein
MKQRRLPPELVDEIYAMLAAGGPAARVRQIEEQRGHHVLPVGITVPFLFDAADWQPDSVVSLDGRRVRIVLVSARQPGSGALTRLVQRIALAGFAPVIVSPVGLTMPAILKHWGWRETVIGTGFDRSEEWTP